MSNHYAVVDISMNLGFFPFTTSNLALKYTRLWLHSSWRTLERAIFSHRSRSSLIYRLPLSSLLTPLPAYRTQLLHPVSPHINRAFSFLQPSAHYARRRPIITQRKIPFEQLIWSMDLETYLLSASRGHARVIP